MVHLKSLVAHILKIVRLTKQYLRSMDNGVCYFSFGHLLTKQTLRLIYYKHVCYQESSEVPVSCLCMCARGHLLWGLFKNCNKDLHNIEIALATRVVLNS